MPLNALARHTSSETDGRPGVMKKKRHYKILLVAIILLVIALVGIWRFTPLKAYTDPETIREALSELRVRWWTPAVIPPVYILAHSIMFPNMVLNAAVILTLGGFIGWTSAVAGSLASASFYFFIGRRFGAERLKELKSERLRKVQRILRKGGVFAVLSVKMVPTAPYPVVNTAAGAIRIRFRDFFIGTFLAHLPGTVTLALFGEQLENVVRMPTAQNMLMLAVIAAAGASVIFLLRRYVTRRMEGESPNEDEANDRQRVE
jgi:phospholipase D1/2